MLQDAVQRGRCIDGLGLIMEVDECRGGDIPSMLCLWFCGGGRRGFFGSGLIFDLFPRIGHGERVWIGACNPVSIILG